jgi:hypothetical protein
MRLTSLASAVSVLKNDAALQIAARLLQWAAAVVVRLARAAEPLWEVAIYSCCLYIIGASSMRSCSLLCRQNVPHSGLQWHLEKLLRLQLLGDTWLQGKDLKFPCHDICFGCQ